MDGQMNLGVRGRRADVQRNGRPVMKFEMRNGRAP
jgi:hypothetical protein